MPLARRLVLLGTSYRTSPVEARERCAVAPEDSAAALRELVAAEGHDEVFLISTCNRTEILISGPGAEAASETVRQRWFLGLGVQECYAYHGTDAVFHLFRVAAGLDSQVLGESEILGQIKDALGRAQDAAAVKSHLQPLVEQALAVGKRVRTETKVGEGTLSVARAAVELAAKVLGRLDRVDALVVGAGETGQLVAKHLRDVGARRIVFCNRTLERAEAAAREHGGEALPLDQLSKVISEVDLTVVSVDAPEPVVRLEHVDAARIRRRDRPPIVIDLSVPRGVDPALAAHAGMLVHGLDDLDAVVSRHHEERRSEVALAENILVEEVHKFLALQAYATLKPVVAGMRARFEEARDAVLGEIDDRELVAALADKLTKRLLNEALTQIKLGTREAFSQERLGETYRQYRERS
ncbi:MAG: glutamyl-tRNA reductase [Planctomycetes bacterium]|nr:glutamyl-tRNA reductase [Planctomycetota bacterium]